MIQILSNHPMLHGCLDLCLALCAHGAFMAVAHAISRYAALADLSCTREAISMPGSPNTTLAVQAKKRHARPWYDAEADPKQLPALSGMWEDFSRLAHRQPGGSDSGERQVPARSGFRLSRGEAMPPLPAADSSSMMPRQLVPRAPFVDSSARRRSPEAHRSEQNTSQRVIAPWVLLGCSPHGYEAARNRSSYLRSNILNAMDLRGLRGSGILGLTADFHGFSPTGPTCIFYVGPRNPLKTKGSPTGPTSPTLPHVRAHIHCIYIFMKNTSRVYRSCPTCLTYRTSIKNQLLTRSDIENACPTCRTA